MHTHALARTHTCALSRVDPDGASLAAVFGADEPFILLQPLETHDAQTASKSDYWESKPTDTFWTWRRFAGARKCLHPHNLNAFKENVIFFFLILAIFLLS